MQPGRAFRNWIEQCGLTFRIKATFKSPDILVLCHAIGILPQKRIYGYHHSKVGLKGEDEHKRMKRLIGPALSAESIRAIFGNVRDVTSRVLNDMTQTVEGMNRCLKNTDILHWTARAALSIVGHVAFPSDFDGGQSQDAEDILKARRQVVAATENRISVDELNEQISTFVMTGYEATTLTLLHLRARKE
ncbi:hypothetical protein C8R44DRAFT_881962 [Mycena epipterygia]|nr:hypothetical protein C8R44DRAFT_881962 [Mycena epipterygia]